MDKAFELTPPAKREKEDSSGGRDSHDPAGKDRHRLRRGSLRDLCVPFSIEEAVGMDGRIFGYQTYDPEQEGLREAVPSENFM